MLFGGIFCDYLAKYFFLSTILMPRVSHDSFSYYRLPSLDNMPKGKDGQHNTSGGVAR